MTNHIMLLSVVMGGCIMHLVYQTAFGVQVSLVLIILSFSRSHPEKYELKYFLIGIAYAILWALLRMWTTRSWEYGIGTEIAGVQYLGVVKTLECWNCTYGEFSLYPLTWLSIHIISIIEARRIIHNDASSDHSWKTALMDYKVTIDVVTLVVQIVFNVSAALWVDEVPQCTLFWIGSDNSMKAIIAIIKTIVYVVPALATYYFYHVNIPKFLRSPQPKVELVDSGPNESLL
jgi:hypothetical protein